MRILAIILILCSQVFGITWDGSFDTDYGTAANWTPANVPTDTDDISINATSAVNCTVAEAIDVRSMSVTNTYDGVIDFGTGFTHEFGIFGHSVSSANPVFGANTVFNVNGSSASASLFPSTLTWNMINLGPVDSFYHENASNAHTINFQGIYRLVNFDTRAGTVTLGKAATTVTLDMNTQGIMCGSFTVISGTSQTLDLSGQTLDVDGNCDLSNATISGVGAIECEGNFTIDATSTLAETVSVTINGTSSVSANVSGNEADLIINAGANTATAATAQFWDTITMTDGTFDWNDQAIDLDLGISGTGGTIDMATSVLTLGGTFNATNITITGSAVGGLPSTIIGGAVQNLNATGAYSRAATSIDVGDSNNVQFFPAKILGGGML